MTRTAPPAEVAKPDAPVLGPSASPTLTPGPVTEPRPTRPRPSSNGRATPPPVPYSTEEGLPDPGAMVTAAPQVGAVRKARLSLTQVDPWSVMKISFVLSLAGGIVLVVAVWLLWQLLAGGDVFISVDRTVGDITGSGSSFSVVEILSLRRVMGVTLMLGVVQVVLVTALATLAAFLFNLTTGLVGGLDVTLTEDR
jgi:Transmembrane domain of unknown function (DUF3566)